MMPTLTIAPVRKTLLVNLSHEKAFDLFAKGIDRWWPRTHHPTASPMTEAVIEPFVGGRWYHSCEDGSEYEFGHVLVWQPSERLMLAWENNCNGYGDREVVMEVDVSFIAEGATSTPVGDQLTLADFALGSAMILAEPAHYPLDAYPAIRRWSGELAALPAWQQTVAAQQPAASAA